MAEIFDPTGLTFNGEEIKSLSEAVFESAFAKPAITTLHRVVTGIVAKKQIAILGRLKGLVGKGAGECNPTSADNQFEATEKFWMPETISDRLEQCWTDLQGTFWIWGLDKGIKKADLTAGDFFNYVEELLNDAVLEAVFRIAWFNDTDAENVADGGVITDTIPGSALVYWNRIDGFWKQIFTIVAATPARKTTSTLTTRNAAVSYVLQEFTAADTTNKVVTAALKQMRFKSDFRLRGEKTAIYLATQSVADQYENELIEFQTPYTLDYLENGVSMLKCGGITVYGFDFWDRMIRTYMDNGTKYNLPHRVVLMTPENFQIGTEEESTFTEFDVFYDKKSKSNFIDFMFNIDAKLILDYLFQASY